MSKATERSGVVTAVRVTLSPEAIAATCHVIIDVASALLMNLEALEDPGLGSREERAEITADARCAVERLVESARSLQKAARAAPPDTGSEDPLLASVIGQLHAYLDDLGAGRAAQSAGLAKVPPGPTRRPAAAR